MGHNWPVFLKFRGGKGAAVLLGVSLGLFPLVTAICLVPVVLVMLLLRNVVAGAAAGYVLVCLVLIFTGTEWQMVALSILLAVLAGGTYLYGFRRAISAMIKGRPVAQPDSVAVSGEIALHVADAGQTGPSENVPWNLRHRKSQFLTGGL